MGGVKSVPKRILRNWNVENRAIRSIDRPDRPAPPRYPTDKRILDQRTQNESLEGLSVPVPGLEKEKNVRLDGWLKKVKVYSHDVPLHQQAIEHDPRRATSERALPQERAAMEDSEFGYHEPTKVLPGKITLKQAMEIMSFHQQDPETYTVTHLAKAFNCSAVDMDALLKHFKVFMLFLPKTKKSQEKSMSYAGAIFSNSNNSALDILNKGSSSEVRALESGPTALKILRAKEAQLDQEDKEAGPPVIQEGARRYLEIEKKQYDAASESEKRNFPYKYGKQD